ncbi:MAG: cobalamin B12-binding domain-containing protein [Pseudomonadota bacterium]
MPADPARGDETELDAFVHLLLAPAEDAVRRHVDRLVVLGTPVERLGRDLLEPAARRLGELWTDDRVDFTAVTVGVWRLQLLARHLDAAFAETTFQGDDRRVLLVPSPGEQHSFGLYAVSGCFRRAGWLVTGAAAPSTRDLVQLVERQWYAVIGLSLAAERGLDALRAAIPQLRRASCNPRLGVMVGGPVFLEHPALAHEIGADVTARDGAEAVRRAARFVARSSSG